MEIYLVFPKILTLIIVFFKTNLNRRIEFVISLKIKEQRDRALEITAQ